ncbi:MAG: bifunctional histidinol-phosphatase/imidazoleglycerol-phosphate dehydratase HisB [Aeromonadales bacterium]|nr:bifunctional histidinol-phosphatase/imidazoleglycerol-phosphate dehydratase HisB [Aeromonadales bacterium]
MAEKYLFIDRDGTLVAEPSDEQVDSCDKVVFEPMVIPSLLRLKDAGYSFVMVSNQDGLGTESFPLDTFTKPHALIVDTLESQGVKFDQILICPHKEEDNCECRKPKLGLVMPYMRDLSWDREHSYFIGDREKDVQMGQNMGIRSIRYDREKNGWAAIADSILSAHRTATVVRNTRETQITISVDLDDPSHSSFDTGMGFFNHMLDQIATHGGISIEAKVKGDLDVDEHHSIEDTGIALGEALLKALGDKRGIGRFGFILPMDEVCAWVFADQTDEDGVGVALDISGRPHHEFTFDAEFTRDKAGEMPAQMVPHFFESLSVAMGLTLHMKVTSGNCHHQIEALFKAFGRARRQALARHGNALPSSKGKL